MISKASKVLDMLMRGESIEIDGETFLMDANFVLCVDRGDVIIKVNFGDVSLQTFIALSDKVTNEQIYISSANKVLNDYKRNM